MAKICDPPLFTGGQCSNVQYGITYRLIIPKVRLNQSSGGFFFGPIGLKIKASLTPLPDGETGVELTHRDGVRRQLFVGTYDPTAYFFSINIFRPDGLPDNCGDPPSNCRCESDDTTIQCAGQQGGICCIPNSSIQEICSRIK